MATHIMDCNHHRQWDSTHQLQSTDEIALYFEACLEASGDDPVFLRRVFANIERAMNRMPDSTSKTKTVCPNDMGGQDISERFTDWDASEELKSEEDLALYFEACLNEDPGDGSLIRAALTDICLAWKALLQRPKRL
jgi:DNA-binding phage protein